MKFKIKMFTILCLLSTTAFAYIPPSFYIIRTIANKNAKFESGILSNKIRFYNSNGDITKTVLETVAINKSMTVQTQITDESGQQLQRHIRQLLGNKEHEKIRPLLYDLLLIRDSANIYDHLKALKLPLKTETELYSTRPETKSESKDNEVPKIPYISETSSALVRYENRVAVVLGVPNETAKGLSMNDRLKDWEQTMQLWVEKDSLIPIKAVLPPSTETNGQWIEYRLSQFQVFKNFLYPRTIQVYRNHSLWAKIEAQEVQNNLKDVALPISKSREEPDSELKDHLELYFKYVR